MLSLILISSFNKYPDKSYKDIVHFIKQNNLENFYSIFLGKVKVEELDFVGIVERYEDSLKLFENIFGEKLHEKEINVNKKKLKDYKHYLYEGGVLSEVNKLMQKNKKYIFKLWLVLKKC